MPVYTQAHQIIDRLKAEPLADITAMLDDYVQGQLQMEGQDKTGQEIVEDFWQAWREQADCTRLQAKLALDGAGMLGSIEAFMADTETPKAAKLAWTEAYRFSRRSQLFDVLGPQLGLTPEQVDDLFRQAQAIEV